MRSLTFTLDTQTGSDQMAPATITVTEQADGSLTFKVSNNADGDGQIGDLRGLFFDVADNGLLGSLSFSGGDITQYAQDGAVTSLGNGNTTSGVPYSPYEVGIEFGTSGISRDDIQSTTFTMSSATRALTLDDLSLEHFAVRQTSVGAEGGDRSGSDKLYGDSPYPVNGQDDVAALGENSVHTSNVFTNDIDIDGTDANGDGVLDMTVTAVNGDAALVGQSIEIVDGITFVIDANGFMTVDASAADYLSQGETVTASYSYDVNDGNGGSDTAAIDITVTGVNDSPDAVDDAAATDEATAVSGNVLDNDSDVDRLDSISVSAVNGDADAVGSPVTLDSGALLTLRADGSYDYDPNGAFDGLNGGESATDSFSYTVSDGNGGSSVASVSIAIDGIGEAHGRHDLSGHDFGTFANKTGKAAQAISNVVMYLEDADSHVIKVKIDDWVGGETDLDNVNLGSYLDDFYADYQLLGVSIKAGNNHNADLGPGEGQLFLIDGDEDIDYTAGGAVPEGFSKDLLAAHADYTFKYIDVFG